LTKTAELTGTEALMPYAKTLTLVLPPIGPAIGEIL
jgi:hypothetical protein